MFWMKKYRLHLWGTTILHLIVFRVGYFPLLLWIPAKNKTKLKKLIQFELRRNTTPQMHRLQLTAIAVIKVSFRIYKNGGYLMSLLQIRSALFLYNNSALFLTTEIHSTKNSKTFLNFFSITWKTFVLICSLFTWFNLPTLNFYYRRFIDSWQIKLIWLIFKTRCYNFTNNRTPFLRYSLTKSLHEILNSFLY